jgi:hypothetical protein
MGENKRVINSEDINKLFGLRSEIYREAIKYLEKLSESEQDQYDNNFRKWLSLFKDIYGDDTDHNLFISHTYFALLIKTLLSIKLSIIHNLDLDEAYEDCCSEDLESIQIFEFKYFNWGNLSKKTFKKIYQRIEGTDFAREDLFQHLYQQLIFSVTRHKIGEFYTPANLVKNMVDDIYEFGNRVLDPSAGSGSFLINIIVKVLNSDKPKSLKSLAIKNIYGIDINPLAVITAKINIFLLFIDYFDFGKDLIPIINIFHVDSLFPEKSQERIFIDLKSLENTFDLIIGNPPWLTYKDLTSREYQNNIRSLADQLEIKPPSQYITHIELAAIFFYAIPTKFLKIGGKIFFVITKSVLNGDHCNKFRAFAPFQNLEIWDFPNYYFFKVDHVCLKAEYIGKSKVSKIEDKYPIKTKLFNDALELQNELFYSTIKFEDDGARLILPERDLKVLNKISTSAYKEGFFQGATLVPRTLVFFEVEEKDNDNGNIIISSDSDVMLRAKKNWRYYFQNKEIENIFHFKTFLNKDLVPFFIKRLKSVFLPVKEDLSFRLEYLQEYPKALNFYNEMNDIYKEKKKQTSNILTLFDNLNYWNKLTKQSKNKHFLIIYNASGSKLKSAVIHNKKRRVIIGSENYYFSTDSKEEAYYLSAILNSPIFTKNIKLIKSSRHIHKRPFSFPIPIFDENNENHKSLAKKAIKCETIAQDLFFKNPNINAEKVRVIINQKLQVIDKIVEDVVFN